MADDEPAGFGEERAFRRGFKQRDRHDDYALDLFGEAEANLADARRVGEILGRLGRFYNPLIDAPIVDLATRRQIVELLEACRPDEARALLRERLRLYLPFEEDVRGRLSFD